MNQRQRIDATRTHRGRPERRPRPIKLDALRIHAQLLTQLVLLVRSLLAKPRGHPLELRVVGDGGLQCVAQFADEGE